MRVVASFILWFFLCVAGQASAAEITLHEETFSVTGRITAVEPSGKRWLMLVKPEKIEGFEGAMPRRLRLMLVKPLAAEGLLRCAPEDIACQDLPSITVPPIGMMVAFRAKLKRPAPPAYPHGFDWQLWLYDQGVDATGFVLGTLTPQAAAPPSWFWRQWFVIQQARINLSQRLYYGLGGSQEGGMAAALIAGTQGYLNKQIQTSMRLSGLTHLISISGLHMTLIAGFAYGVFRYGLALTPFALRFPVKKWAACFALVVAFAYLLISGLSIPAQRSFITTAIFFTAILLDRRPFSLWTLFLAACAIVLVDWHAVYNPGFQMSFLAVLTLILFYGWWGKHNWQESTLRILRFKPTRHLVSMFLSTIVVTLVGAPVTAYHFGSIALYGAISNLIAIPLSGIVLMPALGITVLLMPLGLEHFPLTIAGYSITLLFALSDFIASLKGAQILVPPIPLEALCLMFAGLGVVFYARRFYRLCVVPLAMGAVFLIIQQPQPLFLLSANRQQFGVVEAGTLTIYSLKRDTFLQERWAQYLGISEAQRVDMMLPEKIPDVATCQEGTCIIRVKTMPPRMVQIVLLRNPALLCGQAEIVIAPFQKLDDCGTLATIDSTALQGQGAAAFFMHAKGALEVVTDFGVRGHKPWAYYE